MPFPRKMKNSKLSKAVKKEVKAVIKADAETKYTVYNFPTIDIDTAFDNYTINRNCAQGLTVNERVGNRIRAFKLKTFLTISAPAVNLVAPENVLVRLILYEPLIPGFSLTPTAAQIGLRPQPDLVHVVFDQLFNISNNAGPSGHNIHKTFKYNKVIVYDGALGSSIKTHDLQLMTLSTSNLGPHPQITGYIEVSYKDC